MNPLAVWLFVLAPSAQCPVPATAAFPQLPGDWTITAVSFRDQRQPDSTFATATIARDLDDCLLIERYTNRGSDHPLQMLAIWGTNGRNEGFQRLLTHSRHGLIGLYQGSREGQRLTLRLTDAGGPPTLVVEHLVEFVTPDHFTITSRLSEDGGQRWVTQTVWTYRRSTS